MLYYLTVAGLWLHAFLWGAGLACLVVPRAWRPAWWVVAPWFGFALQSAVVWFAALADLPGTQAYARWSLLLPLALAGVAAWRGAWRRVRVRGALRTAAPVITLLAAAGLLLLWPMAQRGAWTLTSSSLGSCDHADYAAGARVLQEFARSDRVGFLDLPEVTQVGGAARFHDYWLRLNHFTPAAILAHHGALLGLQPHQLVSLHGPLFWLALAPLALLVARAAGWRRRRRWLAVAFLAFSPLGGYAVHHGALAQMLAAGGIALLTLAASRPATPGEALWRRAGVILAALWLLAGSYNFILVIAPLPALAALAFSALRTRSWRPAASVAGLLGALLLLTVLMFPGRFLGIAERFRLLEHYDFGWPIPLLTPEGWVGALQGETLLPLAAATRWPLLALVLGAAAAGIAVLLRRRPGAAWCALAWGGVTVAGWALLAWESRERAHAAYDAFKLLSVFLPLLFAGGLAWVGVATGRWRMPAFAAAGVLAGLNLMAGLGFARAMAVPPLRVERPLLALRAIEDDPAIGSVNIRIEHYWSRLWANALLLRRPQYFVTHSYEARRDTPLRGEWDLSDSLVRVTPYSPGDARVFNAQFHAHRVAAPGALAVTFGPGWHGEEGRGLERWRWTAGGPAVLHVVNPAADPVTVDIVMQVRAPAAGRLRLSVGDRELGSQPVELARREVVFSGVVLTPGATGIVLDCDLPSSRGDHGDERVLGVALYGAEFRAVR